MDEQTKAQPINGFDVSAPPGQLKADLRALAALMDNDAVPDAGPTYDEFVSQWMRDHPKSGKSEIEETTTRIDGPGLEAEYTVTDESGPLTNEQMAAIFSGAYQDTLKVTEGYYSGKYDTPKSWKDRLKPSDATK